MFGFFKKKSVIEEIVHEGVILRKERQKRPLISYSIYMPQSVLDSTYESRKEYYDGFYFIINGSKLLVPYTVFDQYQVGDKVRLKVRQFYKDAGLFSSLNNLTEANKIDIEKIS